MSKKFIILLSCAIFVFCLLITTIILYNTIKPKITLVGDKEIIINLNEEYVEEGATATILKKDVSKNIKIENNINNKKVGTYEVKYIISNKYIKKTASIVRTIKVIDNIFPEIKLKGKSSVTIYVGDKYNEPGYTATDNYDGDLTKKVVITNNVNNKKVGTYEIIYSIVDSSNNKIETKRKVIVKEKPVTINKISGDGVPVLMYHYFYDKNKGETGENSNWMEISAFEKQIKYLVDNNYYFPTWQELADYVDGKISLPKKSIIITIDDGHKSLFEKAIPIIEKYNVRATAFIITSYSAGNKFSKYKTDNMNFQSHTHNMHRGGCSGGHGGLFRCINYNDGLKDLNKSIKILGSHDAIAYPYGDCTDNVIKITKAAGFKVAFTTEYGKVYKGMNKLKLPRIRMSKGISLNGFINSIS